jgi:hypothetical protein
MLCAVSNTSCIKKPKQSSDTVLSNRYRNFNASVLLKRLSFLYQNNVKMTNLKHRVRRVGKYASPVVIYTAEREVSINRRKCLTKFVDVLNSIQEEGTPQTSCPLFLL